MPVLQDLPELPCDFQALRGLTGQEESALLLPLMTALRESGPAELIIAPLATKLVEAARSQRSSTFNDFLSSWRLSSDEGRALLTLAEALLRIPDAATAHRLINDQLTRGNWLGVPREGGLLVHLAGLGMAAGKRFIKDEEGLPGRWHQLLLKMGDSVLNRAIQAALQFMANQFVQGEDMKAALAKRQSGLRYSFDRLGEAAQTGEDARRYTEAYREAIEALSGQPEDKSLLERDGISIKLSALHPRFEYAQWRRLEKELLPRLRTLSDIAAQAGVPITLDAEESERLEISLAIFSEMSRMPALRHWGGLGLAVQAYQKRAPAVLDFLGRIAAEFRHPIPVRLVKGAYWDYEIKRAQQLGLTGYPVYTRKLHTDIAYLACAQRMLMHSGEFYPQFATHNAHTLAWVEACAQKHRSDYEVQKLVGMGDAVHEAFHQETGRPLRLYAPVGSFQTLLPYLVRRLLENGSSQSFVNQLANPEFSTADLVSNPLAEITEPVTAHPRLPSPLQIFGNRPNSPGFHPADAQRLDVLKMHLPKFGSVPATALVAGLSKPATSGEKRFNPANPEDSPGTLLPATAADAEEACRKAAAAFPAWSRRPVQERAELLRALAGQLQKARNELLNLLVREGGKTLNDALADWREAVDFCHYYAAEAERLCSTPQALPAVSGESNTLSLHGRGVFLCISPWNFPLAIFLGQITAALATGNTVIAKPSSQTPLIAFRVVELAHAAGIPIDVLQLLPGPSAELSPVLLNAPALAGVVFTGSTEAAASISRILAERPGARLPLIAETGGLNVMIADSSALPEQLVNDVLASAFTSAGQRCSALRVLWLQEELCEAVLPRLAGALEEWQCGDPANYATDMGPVIDAASMQTLQKSAIELSALATWQARGRLESSHGHFIAPQAFLLARDKLPRAEIFGPLLAIATWKHDELSTVVEWANQTGYGLTLGVHSRIEGTLEYVKQHAQVGNLYLNRNQIGAVVGCQPFGGEGLSGTGFKAGGPHYLLRFMTERTITTNLSALGVNTSLLDIDD
ncbi:MAG: bifunctional proline dehydrogenase/L-glutamate gamma-semialdehyde dehydrogenase PutA [Moraxellaceae bacterium]